MPERDTCEECGGPVRRRLFVEERGHREPLGLCGKRRCTDARFRKKGIGIANAFADQPRRTTERHPAIGRIPLSEFCRRHPGALGEKSLSYHLGKAREAAASHRATGTQLGLLACVHRHPLHKRRLYVDEKPLAALLQGWVR